jgi:hypothetical protein
MVLDLDNVVHSKAEKLCDLVARKFLAGEEADLHHAFCALSVDVLTDYAF